MEIEKITESILKEAKEKAQDIIKEAENTAEKEYADFIEKINKKKKEIDEYAHKSGEEEKKRLVSLYNLEKRMAFVREKNVIVNKLFLEMENKLKTLDKEKYLKWMSSLLDEIAFTGEEIIVLDRNDKYMDAEFLKKYAAQKSVKFRLAKEKEDLGGGGFVVKKGNVEFNSSFNVLLQEIKDSFYSYIGKELFGEE